MPVYTWSTTAANNGTIDPNINFAEGQAPSTVNNSARALMAAFAAYNADISGTLIDTGSSTTANAYAVTTNSGFTSLSVLGKQVLTFVPATTSTGPATLAVDGLAAVPIQIAPGVAMPSGTLVQGTPYTGTYYAGTNSFILWGGFSSNPFSVPVGGMMDYIGTTAPNSAFVLPFGQAISRTVYSTLYALVGTTYGSGDGSTTFNVPDLRGRVVASPDNMGGTAASRLTLIGTTNGSVGGAQNIAIAQGNLPNVNFTGAALSCSVSGSFSGTTAVENQTITFNFSGTTGGMNSADPHSHSSGNFFQIAGGVVGGGGAYGTTVSSSVSSTSINHSHSFSGTTGGQNNNHNHNFSGSVTSTGTTATQSVSSGGSGTALQTIQPTIVIPRILRVI